MRILMSLAVLTAFTATPSLTYGKATTTLATHFGHNEAKITVKSTVPIKNKKGKVVGKRTVRTRVKQDNGVGSPLLNRYSSTKGYSTNNTWVTLAALPAHIICREYNLPPIPKRFGKSYWEKWSVVRDSALEILCHQTGKRAICPLGDLGPARNRVKVGVGADFTHALMLKVAGKRGISQGRVKVSYWFHRGYYTTHPYPIRNPYKTVGGGKRLAKN